MQQPSFSSFLMGGYECADIINNRGNRIDLLQQTFHDQRVVEDYQHLLDLGITTVREGIRWSFVEKEPHQYDFSEVEHRIAAGIKMGIQQVWDICHFGYPTGLTPTHPQFADRFAALCAAFAKLYRRLTDAPLIVTPVNEISFISWLGGDARGTVPFAIHSGFDQKYFLCRAAIKGIEAIKSVDPSAQIMMVEPLVRVHPQEGMDTCKEIEDFNEGQFQAMDIITGKMCPELGGRPDLIDFAGFNYYYDNQWEHGGQTLGWCKVKRRASFAHLLRDAYQRYGVPVVLSETGHFNEHRPNWMELITEDCIEAMKAGVDLRGICIYPVLDRSDWDQGHLIQCGIWTYDEVTGERTVNQDYFDAVKACGQLLDDYFTSRPSFSAADNVHTIAGVEDALLKAV